VYVSLCIVLQLLVNENEYFANNMHLIEYTFKRMLDKLRKLPDKYRFVKVVALFLYHVLVTLKEQCHCFILSL